MPTNYEWLLHMDGEERQAWFDAEHVDDLGQIADMSQKSADCVRNDGKMSETGVSANDVDANDENATCNNSGENVTHDSREKLEADVYNHIAISITPNKENDGVLAPYATVLEWLNRQAEITRKTEQAAWIQQANGLIHEANVRADELQHDYDVRYSLYVESCKHITELEGKVDMLEADLNDWKEYAHILECDCDECDMVKERDALAHDLQDCNREREELRQALGTAIDHAHEITRLVDIEGEVA